MNTIPEPETATPGTTAEQSAESTKTETTDARFEPRLNLINHRGIFLDYDANNGTFVVYFEHEDLQDEDAPVDERETTLHTGSRVNAEYYFTALLLWVVMTEVQREVGELADRTFVTGDTNTAGIVVSGLRELIRSNESETKEVAKVEEGIKAARAEANAGA